MFHHVHDDPVRLPTVSPCSGPVVRAIRGATQVSADDPLLIEAATGELITEVMARNALTGADFISILFTATPDLTATYPARAARAVGLAEVPLICATEIPVPEALPRIVRIMAHVHSARPRQAIHHVYLGGAAALRPDLIADGAPHYRATDHPQGA